MNMCRTVTGFLAVSAALHSLLYSAAACALTLIPPDLAPGSPYRLIFVTSQVSSGTSSDIATYNEFVSSRANSVPELANLGTTWKALASTASVDARDNTATNFTTTDISAPFYRLDGLRVASGNSAFWNAAFLEQSIAVNESGGPTPLSVQSSTGTERSWVWTGTTSGGTKSISSYLGSGSPVAGVAETSVGFTAYSWIGLAITPAANLHALYAVSGVLTAPVPVPTAAVLLFSGVLGLVGFSRRNRHSLLASHQVRGG